MAFVSFPKIGIVLLLACAHATEAWAEPGPPAADPSLEARRLYRQGLAAFRAGRLPEAIDDFTQADRLAPSAALSFDVARVYEAMARTGDALAAYREYLRRAPDASNAGAVRAKLLELESALAPEGVQQLRISSDPSGAEVRVDGRMLGVTPWTGQLAPGLHRLSLSKPGYDEAVRAIELDPAHASELTFTLPGAPPPRSDGAGLAPLPTSAPALRAQPEPDSVVRQRALRPWAFATLGVGAAALLGAGGFELARRSSEKDAHSATSQIGYAGALDSMHTRQSAARIFAVIGGVAVVSGGVLLAVSWHGPRSNAPLSATLGCAPLSCAGRIELGFQ